MKKIVLITTLLLLIPLHLNAQWEILNEGIKGQINTIDFVNENVGWLAGESGALLKTTDGGENWKTISMNESWHIGQIEFINELVGWAVGNIDGDFVWKTNDGGITWQQQISNVWFGSLYVIDENSAYAVGMDTIFKTTDGGVNWIDISPNLPDRNYNSVWFQNSQIGVVVGSYNDGISDKGIILRTTDGGSNWGETIANEFNSIYELQFLNSNAGYFRAHLDTTHFICKTEDMCATWNIITQVPAQNSWSDPIKSCQFLSSTTAYAIMGDSLTEYNVMKSIDGGATWQNIKSLASYERFELKELYFKTNGIGFLLFSICIPAGRGDHSFPIICKSNFEGNDWEIQRFTYLPAGIYFIDANIGFIIGGYGGFHMATRGHIFKTTNSGKTWDVPYLVNTVLKTLEFVNQYVGYTISRDLISKTTDGGNNWITVWENNIDSTGYEFSGNDIDFVNDQIGFAVGRISDSISSGGEILFTTDEGESWELGWQFPDTLNYEYNLNSIYFTDSTGWSVGENGMILKYTQQTGWVKQTSVTNLPLNKVIFSDENHGWIAGGYQNDNGFQKILLRTTSGGVNWINITNIPYLIRDFAFIDNNLGWAIGYTQAGVGGILKTTDGGLTWSIDLGNLPAQLNALHIKDNYGWAVAENGIILHTTDAGAVWVEEENDNSLPTEFVLEQNYPNPFNPVTKIRYSIPSVTLSEVEGSLVTLKVYDVLGREVATLVNEEQQTGVYEIEFSGQTSSIQHLVSGVYFYQFKAGDYSSTKKMLLLK
jgi:photosystem II stability/assembly factor-like uncharacterized protein